MTGIGWMAFVAGGPQFGTCCCMTGIGWMLSGRAQSLFCQRFVFLCDILFVLFPGLFYFVFDKIACLRFKKFGRSVIYICSFVNEKSEHRLRCSDEKE